MFWGGRRRYAWTSPTFTITVDTENVSLEELADRVVRELDKVLS